MTKNNRSLYIGGAVLLALLITLFMWPKLNDPDRDLKKVWAAAEVDCLIMGHSNIALHIHPHLSIAVDGREETIPADIGVVSGCMAEVHTHDDSGTIHIESVSVSREFKLSQFFAVWGKPLNRDGYSLEMTVDGKSSQELENLILRDGQKIILEYKRAAIIK